MSGRLTAGEGREETKVAADGTGVSSGASQERPDLDFSDSRSTLYIYQKQLFVYCKQVSFMLRALKVSIMFKKKKRAKEKGK